MGAAALQARPAGTRPPHQAGRGIIGRVVDLTPEQLVTLRRRVAEERERTATRAAALERDLAEITTASAEAVRDDEHDPEGATIAFERAQVAALLDGARAQAGRLEEAGRRLEGPDAGRCGSCGGPVGYDRLLARPAAVTCVRCADGLAPPR